MIFKSMLHRSDKSQGFTLVELAIVLGVAGLLFGGLWRLMSGGSQQLRDQAAADQMKQVITATKTFLETDAGLTYRNALPQGGASQNLSSIAGNPGYQAGFETLIRAAFNTNSPVNSYGQTYSVHVRRDTATTYSFMVLTNPGGETIPDTSGGRIAGLIGNEGGFIYTQDVCNAAAVVGAATNNAACGAYGGWAFNVNNATQYNMGAWVSGRIAAWTSVTANTDTSIWLARRLYPNGATPPTDYNTMHTSLYLENFAQTNPLLMEKSTSGHDLFLNNSAIFGGGDSITPAGQIQNLRFLSIRQVTNNENANLTVMGCRKYDENTDAVINAACIPAIQFTADMTVNGAFEAWKFQGHRFIYTASDIRVKHNVRPLVKSLDKLSKLTPVAFRYNESRRDQMGIIAQEVEKVYPSLVTTGGNGTKEVDYMGLLGPMLGAIQELKHQNEELKAQISAQQQIIEEIQLYK